MNKKGKLVFIGSIALVSFLHYASLAYGPVGFANVSPSIEKGFYRKINNRDFKVGDTVAVKLPEAIYKTYSGFPWITKDTILLKKIVAIGNDYVCSNGTFVKVQNMFYLVEKKDSQNREIPHINICRVLGKNEIYLINDVKNSFDSRYYGPIDSKNVIAKVIKI